MAKRAADRLAEIETELASLGDGNGPYMPGYEESGRQFHNLAVNQLVAERDRITADPHAYDAAQAAHEAAVERLFDIESFLRS